MNKTEAAAMRALNGGGYLSVFGNGAMYHAAAPDEGPLGSFGKPIALKRAHALSRSLEHFADGCKWPYPSLYRRVSGCKGSMGRT
jgi:hypothetical protein